MANRAFIRFRNITIPSYSIVSDVFARFTAYSDRSDTPVNLRCAFVTEENPDAPISEAELQAFTLTDWVSWNSLAGWTDGIEYDTPDLTEILQDVIDSSGWSYNNSAILIIEDVSSSGQRGFSSVQFNSGDERATLFCDYTAREGTVSESFTVREDLGFSGSIGRRAIVRSSNNELFCVYSHENGAFLQLCCGKSVDNGETWFETVLYSVESTLAMTPTIAIDSDNYLHIAWIDGTYFARQIKYCKYLDGGTPTFQTLTAVRYYIASASIAIDSDDYIHIVWRNRTIIGNVADIYYMQYTTSWQSEQNLTNATTYQFDCSIAIDSIDNIHVVWAGIPTGESITQIRYMKYTTSWSSITELTSSSNPRQLPAIAIDSNDYLHVAWIGSISSIYREVEYIKYTTSWGSVVNLVSTDLALDFSISIAVDSNDYVYILWSQYMLTGRYLLRQATYITSWSIPVTLIPHGIEQGTEPSLVSSLHPTANLLKANIPNMGYALMYDADDYNIMFYGSDDLTWQT